MAELDRLALSFGDTRNAALYFESVIPCNPYFESRVYEVEKYPDRVIKVPTLQEWHEYISRFKAPSGNIVGIFCNADARDALKGVTR